MGGTSRTGTTEQPQPSTPTVISKAGIVSLARGASGFSANNTDRDGISSFEIQSSKIKDIHGDKALAMIS